MRSILIISLLILSSNVMATPIGDCEGTPKEAVIELPSPLNEWGVIMCSPYGHIITNKEGWIWSSPGTYSPVFIPSQMVRANPEPLGNKSYFKKLDWKQLQGKEAESAIANFENGFDKSEEKPNVYSLQAVSVSDKKLGFQFFEFKDHHWGMWCNKECIPDSRFMILNMAKKPNK